MFGLRIQKVKYIHQMENLRGCFLLDMKCPGKNIPSFCLVLGLGTLPTGCSRVKTSTNEKCMEECSQSA